MDFHTPACASRSDEEWGLLLIERHEGAPLRIVPLYGGGIWNAVGSRMRLRHTPRGRPGRRQRGMVQQLTHVDVYCNDERLGAPSCQALVRHGATITFGAAFPRAKLVTHVVEIDRVVLQLSLTKRPRQPLAFPTDPGPPARDPPGGDRRAGGPPWPTPAGGAPRGPPPTGVKLVLCALVATSPRKDSWAIVVAESYRLASHGPPLHTGLVALKGTWPVSSVAQLGRGTVAYAHGPLPNPPLCEAQHTRALPLHLVTEEALRLSHHEGAGVARPLHRHAVPLQHFVEPSRAAPPDPAVQLAAVRVTLHECDRRGAHLFSAPGPTTWGAQLGASTEEEQREQWLREVVEVAAVQRAAEARQGELLPEVQAQNERRAATEARRVAAKRAREATAQEERLMGRHPPKSLQAARGQLKRMWGPA